MNIVEFETKLQNKMEHQIPALILTIKFGLKRHNKCCKDYSLPSKQSMCS